MTTGYQDFPKVTIWLYILFWAIHPGSRKTHSSGLRRQEFPPIFLLTLSNILKGANVALGAPLPLCTICAICLCFRPPKTHCPMRAPSPSTDMHSQAPAASDMSFPSFQNTTIPFPSISSQPLRELIVP